MSYDIKLSKICDNKVVWDDRIVENDFKTVRLDTPVSSTNFVVRINDFKRQADFLNEILLKENITNQITGSTKTFFVSQGPIYNGQKIGKLASRPEDFTVKAKIYEENVSKQLTGTEDYFYTQGRPLMRSNNFDFSLMTAQDDVEVKINGRVLENNEITDFDAKAGRIQFEQSYTIKKNNKNLIETTDYSLNLLNGNLHLITPLVENDILTANYRYSVLVQDEVIATGSQVFYKLTKTPIVKNSYEIRKNGGAPLIEIVDYTLNILTGELLLTVPLISTDIVTATYEYTQTVSSEILIERAIGGETDFVLTYSPVLPKITNTDLVTITYNFQAKVKQFDAIQSRFTIKELLKSGEELKVAYYSQQNDGWYLEKQQTPIIEQTQNVVFYRNKNTNRYFVEKENVSSQFTGKEKKFTTKHKSILPLYQVYSSVLADTLNNAVTVLINGVKQSVASVDAANGIITLFTTPNKNDVVEISYWYQTELTPDRISLDYYVNSTYCDKCSKYSDLLDYSINKLGQYEKVYDENKLFQDLKKIVRTILGSDPIATWYGTTFESVIGTKMFPEITKTKIANEIITALSKLKTAQIKQEEYQNVTGNEFLDAILKCDVQESISDPTLFTVDVVVQTQSGRTVVFQETVQTKG